ncbi:hypothetical protein GWK47_027219 [Chionoecetes opilio]|uniref:Uncharacterized protein n=1 Tax=Chionoecetes opilio TaxID=41210 RepID=A0A8J8WMI1_CHIOP|nr:hypothetical protein GWK47_027219 [Chionoecetes opilio]
MSVLLGCLQEESPEVFLDLKAGDRSFGRVYISLWGHMRRAQQFMALCLGTFGPSYRDTGRMQPLESTVTLVIGRQVYAACGLLRSLDDGFDSSSLVVQKYRRGASVRRGGRRREEVWRPFAICLRGNPDAVFRAPFGEVTGGLEAVGVATRHQPFNVVRVAECGVVVRV